MKVQKGSSGARWGWLVISTPQSLCRWKRDPVCIVEEGGWALGLVWTGAENLAPRWNSEDHPARSLSPSCSVRFFVNI